MKVLVLGVGLQGRAVVHDLDSCRLVDEVIAADLDERSVEAEVRRLGCRKARPAQADASRPDDLRRVIRANAPTVVVCMVPPSLQVYVARAALDAGAHFVSTSYTGGVAEMDREARSRGLTLLPEMGLDPGIDLVMARAAIDDLDEVHGLQMYGGGFPEEAAADNALRYKVAWTFDGVLLAYRRPARLLRRGEEVAIPGEQIFEETHTGTVEIPGVGRLETYPNGNALRYVDLLGLGPKLRDIGRFSMRWPGHAAFWRRIAALGLLADEPTDVDGVRVSPRRFLARHLGPRLSYGDKERDLAVLRVHAWGRKRGRKRTVTLDFLDRRDLRTGLFAMNRTVGYTASIGVQMILRGEIQKRGVLSPARDVPPARLFAELRKRGMKLARRAG